MRKTIALLIVFVFLCIPILEINANAQMEEGNVYKELVLAFDMNLIKAVGHQDLRGAACSCFAMAYVRTITDKKVHYFYEYNDYGNNQYSVNCNWDKYLYYGHGVETEKEAYFELYNAITKGKPAIAQVNGSPQHYVTVVGFENVDSIDSLGPSNFLILDPAGSSFEIVNMDNAGYRLNRFNSTDGSNNHYQVVLPYGSIPKGEFGSVVSNSSSTYTCSGFISNKEHQAYIDTMMQYYISSNVSLSNALDDGKSVVFMFEGGSDNYPSNAYSSSGSNIRNQAVTIVIKKVNGINSIVFYDENCSSIPSQPEDTTGADYNGQTTILDGVYKIQTCNHNGQYGALNVITSQGYYTPSWDKNGFIKGANGINIHTRSSNNAGGAGYGGAWSAGCQLVGTGNSSDNSFNRFMQVVTGINYNVWLSYSSKQFNTVTPWQDVGYYVVDRQLAKQGLRNIYTDTAINAITQFSAEASRNANDNYLINCEKIPCDLLVEVTETCNLYTMPCNSNTAEKFGCVSEKIPQKLYAGDTFTTVVIYKNTENHFWYEVVLSDGTVAYIYSTHTEMMRVNAPYLEDGWFNSNIVGATPLNGILKTDGIIDYVQAVVYKGFNSSSDAVISSKKHFVNNNIYGLRGSTVDNTLHFEKLTSGYFTLAIEVEYSSKYVSNGVLCTSGMCSTVASYNFTFGSVGDLEHSDTPSIDYWISKDIYGEAVNEYKRENRYYLCYRLYDSVSGDNWDNVANDDYSVTLQVFDANGHSISQYTASVDQEWIGFYTGECGYYTIRIFMSGDYFFDVEYSILIEKNVHYVYYDANGGYSAPGIQEISSSEEDVSTKIPLRFGYNFQGWSTSPDATNVEYLPGANLNISESITLYAVWEEKEIVVVDYSIENTNIIFKGYGEYFKFVPYVSTNYLIYGIDENDNLVQVFDENGNELGYNDDFGVGNQFELSLWLEAGKTYYIYVRLFGDLCGTTFFGISRGSVLSFDINGGSNGPNWQFIYCGYGTPISGEVPVRNGYRFLGWSKTPSATSSEYSPGDVFYTNQDVILYAVWERNAPSYTLGDVNGDNKIDQYDYILIKRHCMGTFTLDKTVYISADVNRNGEVDKYDYICVKRYCMGTYMIG